MSATFKVIGAVGMLKTYIIMPLCYFYVLFWKSLVPLIEHRPDI